MLKWLTATVIVLLMSGFVVSLILREVRDRHPGTPWYFAGTLVAVVTSLARIRSSAILVVLGIGLAIVLVYVGQRAERRAKGNSGVLRDGPTP